MVPSDRPGTGATPTVMGREDRGQRRPGKVATMSDAAAAPAIHAVVLDMDGLLIDTEPVWRASETEVFGELGIQISEVDMLATMGLRAVEMVAHWRRQHPWPGAESGDPSDATIAGRVVDGVVDHVISRGEPMPGVAEAVDLIRCLGLRAAIASSSAHRLIDAVCLRLGLEWIEVRCSEIGRAHV